MSEAVSFREKLYEKQYEEFYSMSRINLKNDTIYLVNGKPWGERKYQKELMRINTKAISK